MHLVFDWIRHCELWSLFQEYITWGGKGQGVFGFVFFFSLGGKAFGSLMPNFQKIMKRHLIKRFLEYLILNYWHLAIYNSPVIHYVVW